MSTQPINVTGLEVIEHLDFDIEVPCEICELRGRDPKPGAWWLRRPTCADCGAEPRVYPACDGWVNHFPGGFWTHASCWGLTMHPLSTVTVLGPIGGTP